MTTMKVVVGIPTYNRADLLRETISSALAQSYGDFRLVICDNASDDHTPEVVASFDDSRLEYVRSATNLGIIGNYNRVIELSRDDDAVVMLSDDDVLYPEYLGSVIPPLLESPTVGVVHTAVDLIDERSRVLEHGVTLLEPRGPVTVETGAEYLERSMVSTWTVAFSSALFRVEALARAGGKRPEEFPSADVSLLMRIALEWDFAMLSAPLAGIRVHPGATTAGLSGWTETGYELGTLAENLLERRLGFLGEARLPESRTRSYRAAARSAYRRQVVARIAVQGGRDATWGTTMRSLLGLIRREPRTILLPTTWRLMAAQFGGRHAKRVLKSVSSYGAPP